jgi:Tol biopolymer transport system component
VTRAAAALLAAAAVLAAPASGAFPGRNGPLAFIGPGDGAGLYTRLNAVQPDGTHNRTLAVPQVFAFYGDPDWSPDGNRIAFVGGADPAHVGIWSFRFGRTSVRALGGAGDVCCPAWSPDGRMVAFTQRGSVAIARGGRVTRLHVRGRVGDWAAAGIAIARGGAVYVLSPDGRRSRRVGAGSDPAFAPDGRRLAYARGGALWADGRRLPVRGPVRAPEWSPDGRLIAYGVTRCRFCDEGEVWVVRPDGTHARRLRAAHLDATWGALAWQPQRRGTVDPQ